MLSSTSSSNFRIPKFPWARLWIATVLLVASSLAGWEVFLRSQGFISAVADDPGLWAATRAQLKPYDPGAVAVLGASRVQQGIHLDRFEQSAGNGKPAQLAISGASPLPLLEHLAAEDSFVGTAIVDVTPRLLFIRSEEGGEGLRLWVERMMAGYERKTISGDFWYSFAEHSLSRWMQRHFVFAGENASPRRIARSLLKGKLPKPPHWWVRPDRMQIADYSRIDLEGFRRSREELTKRSGEALTPEEVPSRVSRIRNAVEKIQKRGGRVVLIRMPSSGLLREIEKQRFPRQQYWDILVRDVGARCIHFEDYPQLSGYECPDGSHLTYEDSARFTESLVQIINGEA